jgi:hypothetical protein
LTLIFEPRFNYSKTTDIASGDTFANSFFVWLANSVLELSSLLMTSWIESFLKIALISSWSGIAPIFALVSELSQTIASISSLDESLVTNFVRSSYKCANLSCGM